MNDYTVKEPKSSTKAKNKYNKKTYSRTHISFKHDEINILNAHCQKYGYSKNGFVVQAVKEKIERDTGKSFDEFLKDQQEMQSSYTSTAPSPEPTTSDELAKSPEVFQLD